MAQVKAKTSVKKSTEVNKSTVKAVKSFKKFVSKTLKTLKTTPVIGALVAEFIGTFLLVASIFAVQGQPLFVAFALIGIVFIVGGISGAHVNPAMTVGAFITRKISALRGLGYIVAQLLGATAAYLVLNEFLKGAQTAASVALGAKSQLFHAATLVEPNLNKEWYLFFAELLGAAILALGIATALKSRQNKINSALTYGLSLLIALIVAGSVTAMFLTEANTGLTFVNPAVAIAAAGLSFTMWPIAIYIIAPIIGAIIGFSLIDLLSTEDDSCDCICTISK